MRPATPGTVLTLASTVCLALASFCVPMLKSLYFLKANLASTAFTGELTLGTLGYCLLKDGSTTCSSPSVGYNLDLNAILGITQIQIPAVAAKWITYALVLHIVALGLSAGAFVLGLLAHCQEFAMGCFSSCFASLAASVALVAFIFDIVLFVLVRTRINALPGGSASLGPAVWLVLAGWILLFLSGCAYGCGRRCISSRGPRNADGGRGERAKMDYGYAEEARIEAIRAEEERKARQAHGGGNPSSHLPGFQPYETQPLTGGNKQPDQWLDEEDDVGTQPNNYRDHPQQQQHPSYPTRAGSDSGNSYARGGYAAGIGAGGAAAAGGAMAMGGGYRPNATRQPSDQYYAGGQSTPGGYPPVANDTGYYHDPQADYQQNAYPPQQAQDPYYNNNAAPRSPQQTYADPQQQSYLDPYGAPIPHSVSSHSHAPSGPNVVGGGGGGWNQQQQAQQGYPPQSAPSPQQRYMSPSNAYGANTGGDPRQAMQNNFVRSPPPSQPITPGVNDAYATDPYSAYDAYDEPQPTPPSPANVYAPAPQRLPGQHPASLTPGFLGGGQHEPRDGSAGGHSTYYDASQQQRQQQTPGAGGSGGGGAAAGPSVPGVVEPPSYELSSLAPGQTDVRNGGGGGGGASSGYPREKGGYQPSTPGR